MEIKPAFARTSKKRRSAQSEIADQLQLSSVCNSLVESFDIRLPTNQRAELNELEGEEGEAHLEVEDELVHCFKGKGYRLTNYIPGGVPISFQLPNHNQAFAG